MFDAKPEDRDQIALYIQEIEIDHQAGPDGNMIPVTRVSFGKRGTANYQQIYTKARLKKDNPMLWEAFGAAIERWERDQTLPVDGTALEGWPAISKGMMKACRGIGLRSVEDVAGATDAVREKIGMGFLDLQAKAKAFLAARADSATANRIADLEAKMAQMAADLEEASRTNAALAARLPGDDDEVGDAREQPRRGRPPKIKAAA